MTFLAGLAALAALAYLGLTRRPVSLIRSLVKTASVALLALAAALASAPAVLVLALGLCAAGDWLLSRDGDRAFMAGIAAFAAGHLAYIALFLSHPLSSPDWLTQIGPALAVVALILLGTVMARVLAPRAGALRGPVLVYIPIILGMGLAVLTLPPLGALIWALPAALAFITSDLILAVEKFVLADSHPALRATPFAVWILYWLAQAGLLAAFA